MMHTTPILQLNVGMLVHGIEVFTPEAFKLFQNEYMRILLYDIFKVGKYETTSQYNICYPSKEQGHIVTYEAVQQNVSCSCKKFTVVGILCVHSLKVLEKKNVKRIPPQYILNRWTREANHRNILSCVGVEIHDNPRESIGKRYGHLCRNFREIASCASEHKKLFVYAHDRSVELLKDLERMVKELELNDVVIDSCVVSEQSEFVTPLDSVGTTKVAIGVKRKLVIKRQRSRIKGALEKGKNTKRAKGVKDSATRRVQEQAQVKYQSVTETSCPNQDEMAYQPDRCDIQTFHQNDLTFTQLLLEECNETWNTIVGEKK